MNELQFGLLGVSIAVALAVYGYSHWQQRQYQRRFGSAFEKTAEDVLTQPVIRPEPSVDALLESETAEPLAAEVDEVLAAEVSRPNAADLVCSLVSDATDFTVLLTPHSPVPTSILAPLWQKRFDFGKSVNVCGLNAVSGNWEKVIADSAPHYNALRLSLQLADRSGAISETRLAEFRGLADLIALEHDAAIDAPDVHEAALRAKHLDEFCAEADQMIGLNLLPRSNQPFSGTEVAQAARLFGMSLQADGTFHLLDDQGNTLFTLSNLDNAPFQHHLLDQIHARGITLLLEVPRIEAPVQRFDDMLALARRLAAELRANIVDDRHAPLGDAGLGTIRQQILSIEQLLLTQQLLPGSTQARRLFA